MVTNEHHYFYCKCFELGITDQSFCILLLEKMSLNSSIAYANSLIFKVSNNPVPYNNSSTIKTMLGRFLQLYSYYERIKVIPHRVYPIYC